MSSLIDIAFLLLIYFIVSTTLVKQEADLGLALPGVQSESVSPVQIDHMVVSINAAGAISVNDEVVDTDINDHALPNLTDRLTRYAASASLTGSEALVIVDCSEEAAQQRFIDVLNACDTAGLTNISLAQ